MTQLRRDAARNRAKLTAAGREVFAEQGPDASLEEVARRAGVEIFAEHIEEVIAAAEAAAAAEDAWIGLVSFLEQVLGLQARNLPLRGLFLRHGGGPGIAERRRLIFPLLEQLVERAREQRVVRDDLTVGDLSLAMWSFAPVLEATAGIAPNVWRRHLRILLDGMRPDAATQQEVAPLAGRRLERAIDTLRERYHRRRIAA